MKVPFHIPMKYFPLTFFSDLQVPLLLSTLLHVSLPYIFLESLIILVLPMGLTS